MPGNTFHIFLNGRMTNPATFRMMYQPGDVIIAVDAGFNHVHAMNLIPNILIGDMDSVTQSKLEEHRQRGGAILQYPSHKDETDFELALEYVYEQRPINVNVFAGLGDRLDHTLANLALASSPRFADPEISFWDDEGELFFIHRKRQLDGQPGDIVSLIPWGGEATGVTTLGMQYPLNKETLYPDSSRGVSNVMLTTIAEIQVKTGRLLCIHRKQ